MVLFARGLPSIGKELAQLGKKAVDDVAEEAIEKTVKKEAAEEMAESTAKKEVTDTAEDLSQKTIDKDNALEDSNVIKTKRENVITNQGKKIDVTPSQNHMTTRANPVKGQKPNSSVDILDGNGNIKTRRWFDENGNAIRDVDYTNHGNPKMHPEWPHEHIWDWNQNPPRQ